ncbi:MAG: hypothetical protein RL456_219 [Pseudomonadota bacterium]
MADTASIWLVLLMAAVLANLPFVNERLFSVMPAAGGRKAVAWRLLELAVYTALVILVGRWLEGREGQVAPQGWQFYAVLLCMMATLAFPGFVWRHLRRQR